ncbi:hypothetical protein ACFL59_05020 [Planctomycetota bacterium]
MTSDPLRAPPRCLRVLLREDDVLLFSLIPGTGAEALLPIVEGQFAAADVFPLRAVDSGKAIAAAAAERPEGYRLVCGNFLFGPYDDGLYKHVAQNPLRMTMLRDPVARTACEFREIVENPAHPQHQEVVTEGLDLTQFAKNPRFRPYVYNRQARHLVGATRSVTLEGVDSLADELLLTIAKERLEEMAFFGLHEHLLESAQLLLYTFGWDPDATSADRLAAAEGLSGYGGVSEEAREAIGEQTRVDAELYRLASRLLTQRHEQMIEELIHYHHRWRPQEATAAKVRQLEEIVTEQRDALAVQRRDLKRLKAIEHSWGWRMLVEVSGLRQQLIPPESPVEPLYMGVRRLLLGRWVR